MAGGLSRVTIVSPHSRVDVALPSDVALVDLLPTLLDFAGGAAEEAARRDGWSLSRLDGGELDSSRTPAQLAVRDGELLYLRPRGELAPVTVFDDLVDALATGTRERLGRWTSTTTRLAGLVAGVLGLLAGAGALLFAGPPFAPAGLAGLGVAAVLLVVAMVFARALGEARTGTTFAVVATVYAGAGGLLVLAGDRSLGKLTVAQVSVAATAAVVSAAVASVGIPTAAPLFLGAGVCAVAALVTMAVASALNTGLAAAAAVTVVLAYMMLPAFPMLAYRLAGLPRPNVPTEREQLRQETETVDGVEVIELGRRLEAYLSAMLGALALISAAGAVLVSSTGPVGVAMAGVLGLLPLLRSRWFRSRSQRLPLVLAGGIAFGAAGLAGFHTAGPDVRLLVVVGVNVAVVAVSVVSGLAGQRQHSPPWNRFLDIVEILLILALAPLAVWISGVLEWARAVRG
jgi:type VII secretion integral membrane protein EccD